MSSEQAKRPLPSEGSILLKVILSSLLTIVIILIILFGALISLTPAGSTVGQWLRSFFALDSVQLWWYVTRASGMVAYLLLWLSMVLGLMLSGRSFDLLLDRLFTYDFHEFISLLAIAFLAVHVGVLLVDRYLPYTILQVLVPFISPYRPTWVGIGTISFYLIILVTVTFYLRKFIGMRAFRAIHVLSLLGYLGATLHGVFSGTDTPLPAVKLIYEGSALVVVFLTVFWLVMARLNKSEKNRQAIPHSGHNLAEPKNLTRE